MTNPDIPAGHIDDGELVRYLDNELERDAVAVVRTHLAECGECQAKFDAIRGRSERFQLAMLSADDLPVATPADDIVASIAPNVTRRGIGWGWRIAAMLAVVIGITLTVTPARAWLLERLGPVATLLGGSDDAAVSPEPGVPVVASSVRFSASDTVLFVEFSVRPRGGGVSFDRGTSRTEVSAEVRSGSATDELVVFGSGIRIVNSDTSTADYVVTLPTSIQFVEVRIAGRVVSRSRADAAIVSGGMQWGP